jgi:2-keto-myo-inositol isomerase
MQLALNGATIMRSALEDDVDVAAAAGFTALEVWAGKLEAYLRTHRLDDLRAQMHEGRIAPWCINSIEDITHRDAAGRAALIDELRRLVAVARAIGAPAIVVVPGRHPASFDRAAQVRDATGVLRAMSDAAGDVRLAFEFLGKPRCAVPTLDMAIEIVEQVDRRNVGLVIDTFHFHAGGSSLDDIVRVPAEQLVVLHVNGCEDLPRKQLTDAHRLYPGEGAIPIGEILRRLRTTGWDGVASVEIFRPEYWGQEPREVARTAYERAAAVLTDAGFVLEPAEVGS